jgi:hypothetical protein
MSAGGFHIPEWSKPVVMIKTAVDEMMRIAGTGKLQAIRPRL